MSAEIAVATAEQARSLTDRIKVAVDGTWLLIQEAYTSRAWAALGYTSWDDYCTREFGTSRLRLPREERQEVVSSLREIGMSQRAIAAAMGTSQDTVRRAISGERNRSPEPEVRHDLNDVLREVGIDPAEIDDDEPVDDPKPAPAPRPVIGTDGKTYTQAANPKPTSKPRTDVVVTVNRALLRAQEAARAADEISRQHLASRKAEAATWGRNLSLSMESLQRLLDILSEDHA